MVKASAWRVEDPRFESRLCRDFFGVESYQWLKNWHSMATLPGAWHFRVSAGTGWPGVSILWLGEVESLIFNFYLSVAACKIVRPWDTHACCWDVKQATNKQILVFLHTFELVKESRVQTVEEKQGWIWCLLLTQWTALPLGRLYCCLKSRVGSGVCCSHSGPPYL